MKFHTIFLPELSEGPLGVGRFASHLASNTKWMIGGLGGHHVLEEVANRRHETLGFVLSVRTLAEPPWPTQGACFSLPKESSKDFNRVSRSTTKCVTGSSSSNECQSTDKAERMRQAPTPLKIASYVDHGQDGSNHVECAW